MIIYVDVLIFTNFIIDLLLLLLCSKLTSRSFTKKRLILASFLLSLFSLIIFIPRLNAFAWIFLSVIPSIIGVLVCFKYKTFSLFLLDIFVLFSVSFCFAGLILGLNILLPNDKISVNNGVVYFDISPLVLITSAFCFYIIILFYRKLKAKTLVNSKKVNLELNFKGVNVSVKALVDSGNSLFDMLSDSEIIIIDLNTACLLFSSAEAYFLVENLMPLKTENNERFRVIPVKTISGSAVLPSLKIDSAIIITNSEKNEIKKPLAVIMKDGFNGDYSAIISDRLI